MYSHTLFEQQLRNRMQPALFCVPSDVMNAFAVGEGRQAVIALSDGLLRRLSLEGLAGVFAHELSHIRNQDPRVLGFADMLERLTRVLSLLSQVLLASLPLVWFSELEINWLAIAILVLAPAVSTLGRLALAHRRILAAVSGVAQRQGRKNAKISSPGLRSPRVEEEMRCVHFHRGTRAPKITKLRSLPEPAPAPTTVPAPPESPERCRVLS